MALKALDIFKLLPKTNCKKCGCPTCLAFAMKLAQKQAKLEDCPDVTSAAKAALEGSAAPPIRLVTLGAGEGKIEIGNETVMFRHDETFYHAPGIGVIVPDTLTDAERKARLEAIRKLAFMRVGAVIKVNIVAVENASGAVEPFVKTAAAAAELGLPLVLMSSQSAHIAKVLEAQAGQRPLIHAATESNWKEMAAVAAAHKCPLAVAGPDLEAVAGLAEKVKGAGVEDLVLDFTTGRVADTLQSLTAARRLALKKRVAGLGYPGMTVSRGADPLENLAECCAFVAKYAGLVLPSLTRPEEVLPILPVRQNIYPDPRKPIQVEAKLYEIGQVTPESPLLITTNFSLTYYTVAGEVEASRVAAYIGVIDTEGTSVLTAFASDKLTSEKVSAFLKSKEVKDKVAHRKVILPGYVAVMSGALQEESGWEVMVGPREASGIARYLKTVWKTK